MRLGSLSLEPVYANIIFFRLRDRLVLHNDHPRPQKNMDMTEFVPLESFRRLFAHWWIVLGLTILGGLIGWSIHFFQPPVYEAHAEILITLNINPSIPLSQYDEDLALGSAGDLISSNAVIERVVDNARLQGVNLDGSIAPQSFIAERENSSWVLRVRNSNPETAAILANLWAEQAYAFLLSAQQNMLRAATLGNELNALKTCLTATGQMTVGSVNCGGVSIEDFQKTQQTLLDQIGAAQKQAGDLSPLVLFGMGAAAATPEQPVVYGIAPLTFAGALIGFMLGSGILALRR